MTILPPARLLREHRSLIFLAIVILAVSAIRIRLLDVPLERDEGGFAYMGKLILSGVPPYTEAYDFKPPGLYLMYALFIALFGESGRGIHLGLLIINAGSMALLYAVVRRWMTPAAGIAAAAIYGILAASGSVLGFAAHATHLVVFWMLAGCALLFHDSSRPLRMLSAGAAFGLSALMKQPGAFFVLFGIAAAMLPFERMKAGRSPSRGATVLAGAFIPLALVCGWLGMAGVLRQFYYWNIEYGMEFGSQVPAGSAWVQLAAVFPRVAGPFALIWIAAAGALVWIWLDDFTKPFRLPLTLLAFFSATATAVSFVFRSHYFVMLLPAVAALSAVGIATLATGTARKRKIIGGIISAAFALGLTIGLVRESGYFFADDPVTISATTYFPNAFSAAPEIASYIRSHTGDGEKIAIFGSEPEVLFEAQRPTATRYLYMYFFMEPHPRSLEMEREMSAEVERAAPAMIVFFNQPFSWGSGPGSETYIFDWANSFIKEHYDLTGVVDLVSPSSTIFKWDEDARMYRRAPDASVLVFKRRK